ncbi:Glycyl-tRNA synthetase beta subunit [Caldalkalibacillus thermarum TA2.A1]|uniref:Glycine--tRNA ligase beta subunit n=1 Tax=Caldalkalibacillus thermarum (strain TA2.A1) TaxID=986075 RepID=F5L7K3_CALTT|nr:glycine--tRNA ligase subunit beta [Caldalkalibacillus thermarum]EGL82647.1 Glycyl-tRNA synthetase beta subunit [Caldalkalibacillus thermarum TA2.A1]QZT33365.1 glycine--tRNA ligase subunit beta [Caldalkalibacillus thermarum TA2.A1]
MSQQDVLLEIGLEEIPARFVEESRRQLEERLSEWFNEQRIPFRDSMSFATPRRLAVLLKGVADKQEDQVEVAKGPAKQIALDEQGNWTKAALGFARSQGVEPEELYVDTYKGTEYLFVRKHISGQPTKELLPLMKRVIESMTFPKNMRWGNHEFTFIRPIRWIVAMYGQEVIPLEITGVKSSNQSRGHRFLAGQVTIEDPAQYAEVMKAHYVLVNPDERKATIRKQLQRLEEEHGWLIPIDQDLLEEVTNLVEYPTAIWGTFDEAFLDIPEDVLITSMKEHQRYFPVKNKEGRLLPYFVTIRNGQADTEGIVVKGNEKVLRARLADARFFYEEDKKLEISTALSQLENVIFHEKLGSIGDKVRRVKTLALEVAAMLEFKDPVKAKIGRAADICKFDLVTQMVYEFPELQGKMGEEYARLAGEDEQVAKAIFEHYLPRSSGDQLPQTDVGAVLAIADKLDSVASFFGIGIVPSGSQDPYGLRRQAAGIVSILVDRKWALSLTALFDLAVGILEQRQLLELPRDKVLQELSSFFKLRLKTRMQEEGWRYDIVEAVLEAEDDAVVAMLDKVKALSSEMESETFKPNVEALTRVTNIAKKLDRPLEDVQTDLFEQEEERVLYTRYCQVEEQVNRLAEQGDWQGVLQALFELKDPIDRYFDQVLVMVEEDTLRYNRLNMLASIARLINRFADFGKLVFPTQA